MIPDPYKRIMHRPSKLTVHLFGRRLEEYGFIRNYE